MNYSVTFYHMKNINRFWLLLHPAQSGITFSHSQLDQRIANTEKLLKIELAEMLKSRMWNTNWGRSVWLWNLFMDAIKQDSGGR